MPKEIEAIWLIAKEIGLSWRCLTAYDTLCCLTTQTRGLTAQDHFVVT